MPEGQELSLGDQVSLEIDGTLLDGFVVNISPLTFQLDSYYSFQEGDVSSWKSSAYWKEARAMKLPKPDDEECFWEFDENTSVKLIKKYKCFLNEEAMFNWLRNQWT